MPESLMERLRRYDEARPGIPGEHWFALAAGLWLMTRGRTSTLERIAALATGAALVARAVSGRDGLSGMLARQKRRRLVDRLGRKRPYARYLEIGATWPSEKRVRVPAISQPLGTQVQ
jgi:hypothetical protein